MKTLSLNSKQILSRKGGIISSEDAILSKINRINQKHFSVDISHKIAEHDIQEGSCVFVHENRLAVASTLLKYSECIGVAFKSCIAGERCSYITRGKSTSASYNFVAPFGRPVWVSPSGKPTDIVPTSGYMQVIGISLNENSFLVIIQPKILTNTKDFKNKTQIPILYRNAINQTLPDVNIGSNILVSHDNIISNRPLSIITLEQSLASDTWTFEVASIISNIQVLVYDNGTLRLNSENSVKVENSTITISFDEQKTGLVNFCVLN